MKVWKWKVSPNRGRWMLVLGSTAFIAISYGVGRGIEMYSYPDYAANGLRDTAATTFMLGAGLIFLLALTAVFIYAAVMWLFDIKRVNSA